MAGSFLNALAGGKATSLGKNQSNLISGTLTGNTDFGSFIQHNNETGTSPKAYLNIVFLDEQFKFIKADPVTTTVGSNFRRVSLANNPNASLILQQKAPKNGWAFIFLSNESDEPVYFDNLLVTHDHGRIAEENHYYPFGLKIGSISSKAVNKLGNKYNYQGEFAEHEDETGWDQFDLRMYDPQIGRWTGADPYDEFASPYVGMGNNPVSNVDPSGGFIGAGGWGALAGTAIGFTAGYLIAKNNGASTGSAIGWGLGGAFVGSGLGYGFGESVFGNGSNGYGGMGLHTRAFYEALFGGGNGYTQNFNGKIAGNFALTPNIWGGGSKAVSKIGDVAGSVLENRPIRSGDIKKDIMPLAVTGNSTRFQPTSVALPEVCPCRPISAQGPLVNFNFNITRNVNDGQTHFDPRISDQQFSAINSIGNQLNARPVDRVINSILTYTPRTIPSMSPNDIPSEVAGAYIYFNSGTNSRTNNWTLGMSPVQGVGNTNLENITSQTSRLSSILGSRFSTIVQSNPSWVPNRSIGNLRFNGIIRRRSIVLRLDCRCN